MTSTVEQALTPQEQHGRDIWLKSTFGGEKFFSLVLPDPPFNLTLGLDLALTTPRAERFTRWGLVNDPDCTDGDASTGFLDRCTDPHSAGVIGVRKIANPLPVGPRVLFGITCASCHAGLAAANPPANPNLPRWENIDLTIGNQHLQVGKLFAAHMTTHDPRYHVFRSWPPGTVDTTVLENDHINNPGMITPIFDVPDRPFFALHRNDVAIEVHRNGQGGEDDVGCELAALRVYFNIGMCARECMIGHLANGPGGTQTPIDLEQCRRACPEYIAAEQQVGDLCAFLGTTRAPVLPPAYIDRSVVARGRHVFATACASCHSNGEPPPEDALSDDELRTATSLGINRCRSLTTNWQPDHIWAAFSSDEHKAFGTGFYRDLPLRGAWATAPFLHNNSIGAYSGDPTIAGRLAAYDDAIDELLSPWKRDLTGSIARTTDSITLSTPTGTVTLPAGFPVALYANLDPANPTQNLCPDLLENTGHYFGVWLSPADKYALKEFLKTR
ncbi:MAG: cytochrome c [Kofleriaceae bacterium]|nr:cytochrome c [Kofleriaceae bacterium]